MGSVRPGRFNTQPANWIYNLARQRQYCTVDLLDLAQINLPFLDEPITPSHGQYEKEHTKQWSAKINAADGFIFVTPEYNHSISPVLKNAVDYLFKEWQYKPLCFVSYGSLAGGARAVEQWRLVAAELSMYDLRDQILLPSYTKNLNARGEYQFTEEQTKLANSMLDKLVFWAERMKSVRADLEQPHG